jgi:hypothetical protein
MTGMEISGNTIKFFALVYRPLARGYRFSRGVMVVALLATMSNKRRENP